MFRATNPHNRVNPSPTRDSKVFRLETLYPSSLGWALIWPFRPLLHSQRAKDPTFYWLGILPTIQPTTLFHSLMSALVWLPNARKAHPSSLHQHCQFPWPQNLKTKSLLPHRRAVSSSRVHRPASPSILPQQHLFLRYNRAHPLT